MICIGYTLLTHQGGDSMLKILIAEDDRELCQLFARVLTKNGYRVIGVSNGLEASGS